MLGTVVICLVTHFCLRIWAELRKRFESWNTEFGDMSIHSENELNGSDKEPINDRKESEETKDPGEKKYRKRERPHIENSHNGYDRQEYLDSELPGTYEQYLLRKKLRKDVEGYLASDVPETYEQYSLRKKLEKDIDTRHHHRQIQNLAQEINGVTKAACIFYRGYIWASEKGFKEKHALFATYVTMRKKMSDLRKQLDELQGKVEGKLCTDKSCIANNKIVRGEDSQEYNEITCRKWHTMRKTGQETGIRPRKSGLRLCPRDYSCKNRLCTAWHQKDAKFCTTSWAPCTTWHGGKCEIKLPKEEPPTPIGNEKMENVICTNEKEKCKDPECTRFHFTGMWINTSPKGWIEKTTARNLVPLLTMKPLCSNGRYTNKIPCRIPDCLKRHQYPHIRDKVSPEFNKELDEDKEQTNRNESIVGYEAAEISESSRVSSSTDYTPEAKKSKKNEETKNEARRIERPNEVARLQAEPSGEDIKITDAVYSLLRKDFTNKTIIPLIKELLPCQTCKDKGKSAMECAKTEHWERNSEPYLEDGITRLVNICRKRAADKETKDTEMGSTANHSSSLLTDRCKLENSSEYQTQGQEKENEAARKVARETRKALKKAKKAIKEQRAQNRKKAAKLRIKQERKDEKIKAEMDKIAATQNTTEMEKMIQDTKSPCGYHKDIGVTREECQKTASKHCRECSKPGYLAPSICRPTLSGKGTRVTYPIDQLRQPQGKAKETKMEKEKKEALAKQRASEYPRTRPNTRAYCPKSKRVRGKFSVANDKKLKEKEELEKTQAELKTTDQEINGEQNELSQWSVKKNVRIEKVYLTGLEFIKEYDEKKKEEKKTANTLENYSNKKAEENDLSELDRKKEEGAEKQMDKFKQKTIEYEEATTVTGEHCPSISKKKGITQVNDYQRNLDMRKLTEEEDWWQSVIDTFPKDPETGARIIPPVVRKTIFEVEDPKEGLIQAFKENIDGKKDHFYNIFGTAKLMIKQGISHHLLPRIYTDHLMPHNKRKLLRTRPRARKSITALLEYMREKNPKSRRIIRNT